MSATETTSLRRPRGGLALVLFDGEHAEELQDLDDVPSRLGSSKLLWVDADELSGELAERLASALQLDERRAHELLEEGTRGFNDGGEFVRVRVRTPVAPKSSGASLVTTREGRGE